MSSDGAPLARGAAEETPPALPGRPAVTEEAAMSRIQRDNRERILAAALAAFARDGFRGATVDAIALEAGMSKPNLLYYYPTKERMYLAVLDRVLSTWLDPLRAMDPDGEPVEEIMAYVRAKLAMTAAYPEASRLFAGEVMRGAPVLGETLSGPLRALVEEKAAVIRGWIEAGRLAPHDPVHLIFSIWATTQHYADFAVQVRAVTGRGEMPVEEAAAFLDGLYRRGLAPGG
jgi:TetR/AcrR family transcriptional regulator